MEFAGKVLNDSAVMKKNLGPEHKKPFLCLTLRMIFSNQPADFLKQLDALKSLLRTENVSCYQSVKSEEC